MVRCLDNRAVDMDIYNLEDTFGRAEDLGLIKKRTRFIPNPTKSYPLTNFLYLYKDFYTKNGICILIGKEDMIFHAMKKEV